jgi:hypothetical protein
MTSQDILARNRVVFCHFDSYSTALVFPRKDKTVLWPQALPESSAPMAEPANAGTEDAAMYAGDRVLQAVVAELGLNADDLVYVKEFKHWAQTDGGPVRIHLLRFDTFEAPKATFESLGGTFKAISELRGHAMSELVLLRDVFNLIIGAGGGRA